MLGRRRNRLHTVAPCRKRLANDLVNVEIAACCQPPEKERVGFGICQGLIAFVPPLIRAGLDNCACQEHLPPAAIRHSLVIMIPDARDFGLGCRVAGAPYGKTQEWWPPPGAALR